MPLALACKSLTSRDLLITKRHPQGFHHLMDTQLNFQSITRRTELETWTLAQADIVMDVHRFYLGAVVSDAGFIFEHAMRPGHVQFSNDALKKMSPGHLVHPRAKAQLDDLVSVKKWAIGFSSVFNELCHPASAWPAICEMNLAGVRKTKWIGVCVLISHIFDITRLKFKNHNLKKKKN